MTEKEPSSSVRALTMVSLDHDGRSTGETPILNVYEWPTEGEDLEIKTRHWTVVAYDIILIILPSALLTKASLVAAYGADSQGPDSFTANGQIDQVDSAVPSLVQFNGQLTTLSTIIFVTIISTFVRRYALWKAQNGSTVGELEQLQASISLPKTVTLVWSLRAWSWTSVALVFTWSWYYLLSQASQGEFNYYDSSAFQQNLPIAFLSSTAPSIFEQDPAKLTTAKRATLNGAFYQAVGEIRDGDLSDTVAAVGNQGVDKVGNIKIPVYDQIQFRFGDTPIRVSKSGSWKGWWPSTQSSVLPWSSYQGLGFYAPFTETGVCEDADGSNDTGPCTQAYELTTKIITKKALFSTSYMQANCSLPVVQPATAYPGTNPLFNTVFNMTNTTSDIPSFQISLLWNHTTRSSICNLTSTQVRIAAACKPDGCSAQHVKTKTTDKLDLSLFSNHTHANAFFNNMLLAGGSPSTTDEPTFLSAVIDQVSPLYYGLSSTASADARATYDRQFTSSLNIGVTALLNTYFTVSQQVLVNSSSKHLIDVLFKTTLDPSYVVFNATAAPYEPQYRLSALWLTVDFVACTILLIAAILSVILRKKTLAPDIFGYVSSLTRDNPLVHLPDGGSSLSGLDRARMLRHVQVRIADVGGADGKGRVGLAQVGESAMGRLTKGKQYV